MSDLVHRDHVKAKYNKIFYMGVMIVVAQLLKLCADQSFITTLIDEAESKIDGKFAGLESEAGSQHQTRSERILKHTTDATHHHHPVMSAHEIDQAAEERFKYVSNKFKKEKVDDFNLHEKVEPINNKTRKVHEMSQKDFEAGTQRL